MENLLHQKNELEMMTNKAPGEESLICLCFELIFGQNNIKSGH